MKRAYHRPGSRLRDLARELNARVERHAGRGVCVAVRGLAEGERSRGELRGRKDFFARPLLFRGAEGIGWACAFISGIGSGRERERERRVRLGGGRLGEIS